MISRSCTLPGIDTVTIPHAMPFLFICFSGSIKDAKENNLINVYIGVKTTLFFWE